MTRYILLLMILCISAACSDNESVSRLISLELEAKKTWHDGDESKADSIGSVMSEIAGKAGEKEFLIKGYYYSSYCNPECPDSVAERKQRLLHKAYDMAVETCSDSMMCKTLTQLGVWEMLYKHSFPVAGYYFNKAVKVAENAGIQRLALTASVNLSEIYRIQNDTLGKMHNQKLLEEAIRSDNRDVMFLSAFHRVLYDIPTAKDTSELRPYIDQINKSAMYPGAADLVYAKFFYAKGLYDDAEKYILRADTSLYSDHIILYANILTRTGRYHESEAILQKTLDKGVSYLDAGPARIHLAMSENRHHLGQDAEAYESLMKYIKEKSVSDSIANKKELDKYKIEFDVLKKDGEIYRQKAEMSRLYTVIGFIVVLLVVIISGGALYIHRRNKLYRNIVGRNMESGDIPRPTVQEKGVSADKADEIYSDLLMLMERDQIWRDITITRESLAERIKCNRTYLSDVINQKTGMNYSRFMNSFRLKEAIRILSDPTDKTPLKELPSKLGFISTSYFCTLFKQETGLTPSAFRKTAIKISSDKKH